MRKFIQSQANIYAAYYNSDIKVLLKENTDEIYVVDKHNIVLFIFDDDEEILGFSYRKIKFHDLYKLIKSLGYERIGYYNSNYLLYFWNNDAYNAFSKETLDKFINEDCPDNLKSNFNFLKQ